MSPHPTITILDWGLPARFMTAIVDGATIRLERPPRPSVIDQACAAYATHQVAALHMLHYGFYGYLRLCNSLCTARTGRSIFSLGTIPWRTWYDTQKPPVEAVSEAVCGLAEVPVAVDDKASG